MAELSALQTEVTQLRQAAREQQRALRLAAERASHAAQAESEASRLRTLLDREKNALGAAKAQHAKVSQCPFIKKILINNESIKYRIFKICFRNWKKKKIDFSLGYKSRNLV